MAEKKGHKVRTLRWKPTSGAQMIFWKTEHETADEMRFALTQHVCPVAMTKPLAIASAAPTMGPPPAARLTTGRKHACRAPTVPARSSGEMLATCSRMLSHAPGSGRTSSTVAGSGASSPGPPQ